MTLLERAYSLLHFEGESEFEFYGRLEAALKRKGDQMNHPSSEED